MSNEFAEDTDEIVATCERDAGPKVRLLTLDQVDGRTLAAKRVRDVIGTLQSDLGGADRLTEAQRQLVTRGALLGAFLEHCEASWINGESVDIAGYLSAINAQRRVLATIGLERRARDVSGSLAEHIASRSKGAAAA